MTDPKDTDTAELKEALRKGPIREGEGPEGIELFDIEGTHDTMFEAADAIESLEAQVAELEKRTLMAETANIGYRMERDEDHATISRLREAGRALADWCEHEVGADLELTPGLEEIRQALAREPSPDIGTSPEQVDPERLEFLRESFREFIQDHDADNPMNVNQTDDLVFIALSCLGLEKPTPEPEKENG